MDEVLLGSVLERLKSHPLGEPEEAILLAALDGDVSHDTSTGGDVEPKAEPVAPGQAFLSSVTVAGFRGIGPAATLRLSPGPGLTVVCGRNGSGKSSFAEALEVLVTGTVRRMKARSAVWQDTWRCVHGGDPEISAEVLLNGVNGPTILRRTWDPGAKKVDDGSGTVQPPGEPRRQGDLPGWRTTLEARRPFLSHAELEALLAEPKDLYDQLNRLLGLDDVEDAQKRLVADRKVADEEVKQSKQATGELIEHATQVDDERAARAVALLGARAPDVDQLEGLATGIVDLDSGPLTVLESLIRLTVPSQWVVTEAASNLRAAVDRVRAVRTASVEVATSTIDLLERALAVSEGSADCPVCGAVGVLDSSWRARTDSVISELRSSSTEARAADAELRRLQAGAAELLSPLPSVLQGATDFGPEVIAAIEATASAWREWAAPVAVRIDGATLAAHLERTYPAVEEALDNLVMVATAERDRRQDQWTPVAREIAEWCAGARRAVDAKARSVQVKAAENWLKAAADELRNDRLRPFADRTVDLWRRLRQGSNVDLVEVRLAGAANRSHVEFKVDVDGNSAAGLGVMSQGEVNALALSVFLPRATLPGSPFGFVVIDDPVQAMDPSKVDGLARVLCEAATDRQVIVFTHDDRLPESLRRLDLPARVVQVLRRPGSVVEVIPGGDPCEGILRDVNAVVRDQAVPPEVATRVVPGLCRSAIETACNEIIRSKRLRAGGSHEEVDSLIVSAPKTVERLALALFDDSERGGEVYAYLSRRFGPWAVPTVKACQAGSHEAITGGMSGLLQDTRRFVDELRRVAA